VVEGQEWGEGEMCGSWGGDNKPLFPPAKRSVDRRKLTQWDT